MARMGFPVLLGIFNSIVSLVEIVPPFYTIYASVGHSGVQCEGRV